MDIKILQMTEGARAARGIAVIIDVFRAFSVEAYCFSKGAKKIIPIGNIELAYKLKENNPDIILAGERHGRIMPGFDMGNSPSELVSAELDGRIVVHTTSAGTQGIANAERADEILGAGLVNARATAEYIKKSGAAEVSLVCMGLEAVSETEEDMLCAEYIKSLLENRRVDMVSEIEKLKTTSGAKFFDKNQSDVFPEADFAMCTELDKFNFIMRLKKDCDGTSYMERIDL